MEEIMEEYGVSILLLMIGGSVLAMFQLIMSYI